MVRFCAGWRPRAERQRARIIPTSAGKDRDMAKPQQPELHRSGKGATDPASAKSKVEVTAVEGASGAAGPGPVDNQPGHHPAEEQDKPVRRYRQRARAVAAEAEQAEAEQAARQQAERTITEGKIDVRGMSFRVF